MKNKQYYTYKFNSSRLKEFDYNISLSFDDALKYGEVISLFDNQVLRSIRDIHNRHVDMSYVEYLEKEKKQIERSSHSEENSKRIKEIRDELNTLFFVPEYITIVMDHPSHYKYLYEKNLILNGNAFVRFSSSAGQARNSTVTFCEKDTAAKLDEILNNGRNLQKPLTPSKFNAYKGLATSSTSVVSTPNFCLVPDYYSNTEVDVNFVTETGLADDDIIDVRTITEAFNRFDGQGLISYEKSAEWARELGLDYVPAQWCIRNSFLKGMLNTFPIHEFCEKINNGNTKIRTSYKDVNGNPVIVDLKDQDVVISESQLKLWDSWDSIEEYKENCDKNNLKWGVSLHSPRQDKDILKMNYQFLQTLDLSKQDIQDICEMFVDWIRRVTYKDPYYTIMFLLGADVNEEKIVEYLNKGDNYWIKSLIINPELINDTYIKKKIYDLIKIKINSGCLGEIFVDGNFQTLVSDPYAMMQHVCGLEVTGILGKREYYSNYWNKKNVKVVDSMRAPLTYRSEHLLLNLVDNEEVNYWYRHNYTGVIVNAHGAETMNWAGSDFDFDIIATTSNKTIISSVYQNDLPVVYDAPKPEKKVLEKDDLYNADLFSFGSAIGSITNKSTTGYSLLPLFKENSKEYMVLENRIRMCTKLQSAQIDKAKIGRKVKGIPSTWVNYQRINEDDSEELKIEKEFLNEVLMDKHPYFFTYLYKGTKRKYKKYKEENDITCRQKFGMGIDELLQKRRKNKEEMNFVNNYHKYSPVIDSDCVMNNICKYIESVDFEIKQQRNVKESGVYKELMSDKDRIIEDKKYKEIVKNYNKYKKSINKLLATTYMSHSNRSFYDGEKVKYLSGQYTLFKEKMNEISSDKREIADYLIHLFYVGKPDSNKQNLWNMYGEILFENISKNSNNRTLIPVIDEQGEYMYLGKKYSLKEVKI